MSHQPVLYQETINHLQPKSGGRYVDGTVGAGGHARGILEASAPDGQLLGIDLDPGALDLARSRLSPYGDRVTLVQASYVRMRELIAAQGWEAVDGILLDLGVSSMQLDDPARGFSFREDAPLDMRFDPGDRTKPTAAELVNTLPEAEIADILYEFGEERRSRQIARAIVESRPIQTTGELAALVRRINRGGRIVPATRTFQALRIAVNRELETIEMVLPQAVDVLAPGGRLAVLAFHSLEDRIVKQFFRTESRDCICPPEQPVCTCDHAATIQEITRRPIQASEVESEQNPRSRSARLRVAEKLA